MKILILGGTKFVGRHIVEKALERGHEVTLFHRGQTGADLFPSVQHVFGDRDGGLDALGTDVAWDWVIDTSGYVPRIVRQACEAVKGRTSQYLFISTISVYADFEQTGIDENSELATVNDPATETVDAETYGGLKVLCEHEVLTAFPEALIVRPGMIVGPYDHTDRYTYWFLRATKGGQMLSLCERDEPAQFIDGRDLANFCLHLLEMQSTGIFNATGPQFPMTWGDIFDEGALSANSSYEIVRPPLNWLKEHGVESLPAQVPMEDGKPGIYRIDVEKAVNAGLRFTPLGETVRDTIAWRKSDETPLKVGPSAQQEAELIGEFVGAAS